MKKLVMLLAVPSLFACGGSSMSVELNSDDREGQALTSGVDLTSVKAVRLTISEVSAHIAGGDDDEDVKGEDVKDDGKGWVVLRDEPLELDLMQIRADATKPLGEAVSVPSGKITQIRLKVKAGEDITDGVRLVGAVTQSDDTVCDLILPKSAINPGIKISGVYKAAKIQSEGHVAVVNLKLKDSSKLDGAACVYKLNPVLKVKNLSKLEAKK